MNVKKYKIPDIEPLILLPPPAYYNGKEIVFPVSIIEESDLYASPVQTAAKNILAGRNEWGKEIKNPIGYLMFLIFNQETSDKLNLSVCVRDDMENAVLDLTKWTIKQTNYFLFESQEIDSEQQQQIASILLAVHNDDDLREILIGELLYEAMVTNLEDWPGLRN